MKALKITLISVGSLILIYVIYMLIKGERKDDVTGVKNSKIKEAAIKSGIPDAAATKIADAGNSAVAGRLMGLNSIDANLIANGIPIGTDIIRYPPCQTGAGGSIINAPCKTTTGTKVENNISASV